MNTINVIDVIVEYFSQQFMTHLLWAMLALVVVFIIGVIKGPSIWDRLLSMSMVSLKVIVVIVVLAYISDTAYLLDLAIIYALFGFISEIFIALFVADRAKEDSAREGRK
ncbi:MAG: monovalent cation/H+ antiporter complex subunit F [Defluviitaleaceae bacterium]|nr:monovalent cation/H+ antiporter complex subunit F [Defluviitaleaceae bacterium]